MCLILFAYHMHPDYRLILTANRDEFYDRPTAPLAFWDDGENILAGPRYQRRRHLARRYPNRPFCGHYQLPEPGLQPGDGTFEGLDIKHLLIG